jgi:hypothetical protein
VGGGYHIHTFKPSNFHTFKLSHLQTFTPSNLQTFKLSNSSAQPIIQMHTFIKHILLSTLTAATSAASAAPTFSCCAQTDAHQHARADAYAPISVMNDHTHEAGGWMLSYRFMHMEMDGMRHGTDRVSSADVFAADGGYTVTPENMSMQMHMLGAMYAPNDTLTLMLMANYQAIEMDHRINPGMPGNMLRMANGGSDKITTKTDGLGDIKLSALYKFYDQDTRRAHLGLGLSLPTGSIDEKDKLPVMMQGQVNSVLPAPMQLGSGTYDLLPSLTFREQFEAWSYGVQASGVIRLEDENDEDYRLGHKFDLTAWASTNLVEWISLGSGLSYNYAGKMDGDQKHINQGPTMAGIHTVTTAYEDNTGGERLDYLLGVNLLGTSGILKGHNLGIDIRLPLWQDLNGYQLETDWVLSVGWRKAF